MKTNYAIKQVIGSIVFIGLLFVSAGTFKYRQGLVYFGIAIIMIILNYTIFKLDPSLSEERSKPGKGTLAWDKKILALLSITTLAMYIVAGLDSGRYHWSPEFPSSLYVTGIILTILGQVLFLVAQKQNKFFSSTVRVQTDRQQEVCAHGVYTLVRHPAYLGSIIQLVGFPLLFCSLWSIIPVLISIILFLIRTNLEDKTLKQELPGYLEYSYKTHFKIIPHAW